MKRKMDKATRGGGVHVLPAEKRLSAGGLDSQKHKRSHEI